MRMNVMLTASVTDWVNKMNTWPSTLPAPSWGTKEKYYRPQERVDFEANYVQVGSKSLRGRKRWPDLKWELLSEAEYQVLEAFFDANQGSSFIWPHPVTGVSHTCVFSTDEIECTWASAGWRGGVSCPIEEL